MVKFEQDGDRLRASWTNLPGIWQFSSFVSAPLADAFQRQLVDRTFKVTQRDDGRIVLEAREF